MLLKSPLVNSITVGFFALIPLIVLELLNRDKFNQGFPYPLFIFIWLLQTVFLYVMIPMGKGIISQKNFFKNPTELLLRILILVVSGYAWGRLIHDQWVCFIGIPNCD